jgi:hypothetical protein
VVVSFDEPSVQATLRNACQEKDPHEDHPAFTQVPGSLTVAPAENTCQAVGVFVASSERTLFLYVDIGISKSNGKGIILLEH